MMKVSKQVPDGILRPALCPRIGELRFLWVIVPRRLGRTRGYRGRAWQVAHLLCPGLKLLPFMECTVDNSRRKIRNVPMTRELQPFPIRENQDWSAAVHPMKGKPMVLN